MELFILQPNSSTLITTWSEIALTKHSPSCMLESTLLKLKEDYCRLLDNEKSMSIPHFIILMKVEFKSNSEEIKSSTFQSLSTKLLSISLINKTVHLSQDSSMLIWLNMKEKTNQLQAQIFMTIIEIKLWLQLNKYSVTQEMSMFTWKMLTCTNFNTMKTQVHTNTLMLLQISVEEDCGVSDISSIELEASSKKLEEISFILSKKTDQRYLSMEPSLPLLESTLPPKDQVEFQML